ncbi:spondin-1-like [Diadema antillarum]|uniref:spondin-1-like n=1 Tax=Diadema antillarum TaxID=105358 RepID=UPI003A884458
MGSFDFKFGTLIVVLLIWTAYSQEENSCDPVMISGVSKRSGSNGYRIRIDGQPSYYTPGGQYRVYLQSTPPVSFKDFFLVASREDAPSEAAGDLGITDRRTTQYSRTCSHAVTHSGRVTKSSVLVTWTAPPAGTGCVNFRAGVVQKKTVWFAEDDELTLQICEREGAATTPAPHEGPDPTACCAPPNQEAKYIMTFISTWTPETHPYQYPEGRGNHWSDLIGASHSPAYTIWDYGQYATQGVKMVAEWGSPITLEREIKLEGTNVKTVILSRGLFPAYGVTRNMTSLFNVDSRRNLVSALSMMGPSPDWCVGITRENMCTEDCGWVERKVFYLQPWDAGTDSGRTYKASNAPLEPPERIQPITSTDQRWRSFYRRDRSAIPPLATIILERLDIRNRTSPDTDHSVDPNTGVMPPKKGMMGGGPTMPPKVMGHNPSMPPKVMGPDPTMPPKVMGPDPTMPPKVMGLDPTMPPKVMGPDPTMPPKQLGVTMPPKNMGEGTDLQTMPPKRRGGRVRDCMMTAWGPWSECSKSCGKGKRTRQRMIKQRPRNGGLACGPTREKENCNLGRCTSRGKSRDCVMGAWSPWSECTISCGEGEQFRMRSIKRTQRGRGAECGALKELRVCNANPC